MGASCKTAELCNGVARIHTHKQTHSVLKKVKFNCMAQKLGLLNFFLISLRTKVLILPFFVHCVQEYCKKDSSSEME